MVILENIAHQVNGVRHLAGSGIIGGNLANLPGHRIFTGDPYA